MLNSPWGRNIFISINSKQFLGTRQKFLERYLHRAHKIRTMEFSSIFMTGELRIDTNASPFSVPFLRKIEESTNTEVVWFVHVNQRGCPVTVCFHFQACGRRVGALSRGCCGPPCLRPSWRRPCGHKTSTPPMASTFSIQTNSQSPLFKAILLQITIYFPN